ncbi:MAG: DNA mismatch repair endonuclease MutL [Clostridia bacterium]|nr:DNA mismatch repair endonuclease MutL [Clostridia bacterium]
MGKIFLLDELTINKIAAGEVIERPASVIKEMVENSIDAKATNVTIEIRNGGISYIKITDNGTGIAQDDLEIAFERHATSKIRSAKDLNSVVSMGFRGEALASIAAISNVELTSKTENQQSGYKIVVEGGDVVNKEEVACQTGTSIVVRNLFYNTPVRYKFLKKDYTETGYIEDVVTRLALINPKVAIKLVNTGKTIIQTSGNGSLRDVVYSIYGKDVAQGLLDVDYRYEDVRIKGVIGRPEIARSNRSNQLFFVNKRYIKDRILTSATEQAYKNLMEIGKFAFVVLNIEMPPHKVDVNVHPAKLEVRFEEENKIFKAIYHAIEVTLEKSSQTTTRIDNIIIQEKAEFKPQIKNEEIIEEAKKEEKEKRFGSFLSKRKNRYDFGSGDNIIETLYNEKKNENYAEFFANEDKKNAESEKVENIVNTSDVLQELKNINESIKKDIDNEQIKKEEVKEDTNNIVEDSNYIQAEQPIFTPIEDKKLPDGSTYTYVGENKERIESLLRQLHPEKYQAETKVAESSVDYNIENEPTVETASNIETNTVDEENLKTFGVNQKFDIIRQNLEKLDANENVKAEENANIEPKEEKQEYPEMGEKQEKDEIIEEPKNEEIDQHDDANIQEQLDKKEIDATMPFKIEKEEPVIEKTQKLETSSSFNSMYEKLFGTKVIQDDEDKKIEKEVDAIDIANENVSMFDGIEKYNRPTYKIIGVVFGTYIIVEIEKEMYIINERVARERIIFDKIKKNFNSYSNKDSQMLLLPDIINLNSREMEVAKENMKMFTQAGFVLEEFGENTIKLSGVPSACMQLNTKELFYQIIEQINTVARTDIQGKIDKFIEKLAEEISKKEKQIETIQEVDSLLENLLQIQEPFVYVPNKQVALKMSKYDIERKFSRK